MNDPQIFRELDLPTLERLGRVWAKRYPAIKKISLYQGVEQSIEYVLVAEADEVLDEDASGYPEYRKFINDWSVPTGLHIQDDLLKLGSSADRWSRWAKRPNEKLPKALLVEELSWVIYSRPDLKEEQEFLAFTLGAFDWASDIPNHSFNKEFALDKLRKEIDDMEECEARKCKGSKRKRGAH